MATIAVQTLPANGQGLAGITWTPASGGGDDFDNSGNEIVLVRAGATWTTETAQIEGVPAPDSGRDGTATLDPQAVNGVDVGGPYPGRNWNAAGSVLLTYPGGVTGLDVAVVRVPRG